MSLYMEDAKNLTMNLSTRLPPDFKCVTAMNSSNPQPSYEYQFAISGTNFSEANTEKVFYVIWREQRRSVAYD